MDTEDIGNYKVCPEAFAATVALQLPYSKTKHRLAR